MSDMLIELAATLDSLNWDDMLATSSRLEQLLTRINNSRQALRDAFRSIPRERLEDIADLSHETTTHYKWYVLGDPKRRYIVWLHDYKPESLRRPGYAEVPHNHRYWFTSLILAGGFRHHIYKVVRNELDPHTYKSIDLIATSSHEKGTIYSIDPETVHSLSELKEPTLTLVVQSRPYKQYSEVFSLHDHKIQHYYAFSSRIDTFSDIIDLI